MIPTEAEALTRRGRAAQLLGRWVTLIGSVAVTLPLPLWLFWGEAGQRRWAITACLVGVLLCTVAVWLFQRAVARQDMSAAFAAVRPGGAARGVQPLPGRLPSRWPTRARAAVAVGGAVTAAVGLCALASGAAVRPAQVERIHAAGGVITDVPVRSVTGAVRHDPSRGGSFYTAEAVVSLPSEGTGQTKTISVATKTSDQLRPGSSVTVLYAPSDPGLGAVAGRASDLRRSLAGMTLSSGLSQVFLAIWLVAVGGGALAALRSSRAVRDLSESGRRVRVLRGVCAGSGTLPLAGGKDKAKNETDPGCVAIETSSGTAHFLPGVPAAALVESIGTEQLWLCWDAEPDREKQGTSPKPVPAALVADSGWVLHGAVPLADAGRLDDRATVPGEAAAPVDTARTVRLWDPRSAWPLRVSSVGPVAVALTALCAAALALYGLDGWRWWIAVGGLVCLATAGAAQILAFSPAEEATASPAVSSASRK